MINRNTEKKRTSGISIAINNSTFDIQNNHNNQPNYKLKVANNLQLKSDAYQLAYKCYVEKGYLDKAHNQNREYHISHDKIKDTIIFSVYQDNHIAGTMTLVFDDKLPIPSSVLFSSQLNKFRSKRSRLAEVTRLTIDKRFRNSKKILSLLIDSMMSYCHFNNKADGLICEVHPHHSKFYINLLGFSTISDVKPCPLVNGSLAVCLYMPLSNYLNQIKNKSKSKYKYYKDFRRIGDAKAHADFLKTQHNEELGVSIPEILFS
ncbi:MAG: hypothetical protein COA79_17845 [Planctomycetota bacterium]|nr:MAG: hypothetical protein COA79_17845 [Planctomycetota bacterium]